MVGLGELQKNSVSRLSNFSWPILDSASIGIFVIPNIYLLIAQKFHFSSKVFFHSYRVQTKEGQWCVSIVYIIRCLRTQQRQRIDRNYLTTDGGKTLLFFLYTQKKRMDFTVNFTSIPTVCFIKAGIYFLPIQGGRNFFFAPL